MVHNIIIIMTFAIVVVLQNCSLVATSTRWVSIYRILIAAITHTAIVS